MHKTYKKGLPIFGMNCGSVGFLMNDYAPNDLLERLGITEAQAIHPLRMKVKTAHGKTQFGAGVQRSVDAARDAASGEAAHFDRRARAA